MSMFECFNCGGAIGVFCHCKEPALSEEHAKKIREKRLAEEKKENPSDVKNTGEER